MNQHPIEIEFQECLDKIPAEWKEYYSHFDDGDLQMEISVKRHILFHRGWRINGSGTFGSPYWISFSKWDDSSNQDDKKICNKVAYDYEHSRKEILNRFYNELEAFNHIWNAILKAGESDED